MTRHDISECLPFWDRLSEKSRQRLRENAIFRRYKPGENVIFKTVKKDGIVFVLEGKLRVYLSSGAGREITLFKLPKGEAFSIMTVDNARDNDVVPSLQSLDNTTLAYLQRSDMAPVAYEEPLMANFIFEACAKTAQHILNNISYSFFNPLRSCVARVLLERLSDDNPDSGEVRITHEDIANDLGTTRVVISRELDHMRDMGLISTGRGKIYILDRGGLAAIAGE